MDVMGSDVPNKSLRSWRRHQGSVRDHQAISVDQSALSELQSADIFDGRPYKLDRAFEKAVKNAHQLKWLCVPRGATPEDLRWISEMKQLRGLSLSRAKLRNAELRPLQSLSSLQWLNLEGAELPPADMSRLPDLPRLEVLVMDDVRPFEGQCDTAGQFPSLRALSAARTVITDDGLRKLVASSPKLRYLDISGPSKRITVASIPELAKLTELKVLAIGDIAYAEQMTLIDDMPKLQRDLPECWIYAGD